MSASCTTSTRAVLIKVPPLGIFDSRSCRKTRGKPWPNIKSTLAYHCILGCREVIILHNMSLQLTSIGTYWQIHKWFRKPDNHMLLQRQRRQHHPPTENNGTQVLRFVYHHALLMEAFVSSVKGTWRETYWCSKRPATVATGSAPISCIHNFGIAWFTWPTNILTGWLCDILWYNVTFHCFTLCEWSSNRKPTLRILTLILSAGM